MCEGQGGLLTALQMSSICCLVYRRCAYRQWEVVRDVPKYPSPPGGARLGLGSLFVDLRSRRGVRRACNASSMCVFSFDRLKSLYV